MITQTGYSNFLGTKNQELGTALCNNASETLTSAQKQLWAKAEQAMEKGKEGNALFFAQCLLRSAPEFLAARKLAREAARAVCATRSHGLFKKIQHKIQTLLLLQKATLLMKRHDLPGALMILERILETVPDDLLANRMMVSVALQWLPPCYALALFAMETAAKTRPDDLSLQLELAALCLRPDATGESWNPERAMEAYHHILSREPHHLAARQGLNNASALLSIKNGDWKKT